MKRGLKEFIFLSLVVLLVIPIFVSADLGPKSSLNVHVTLDGQNLTEEQGEFFLSEILSCQEEGNNGYIPIKDLHPRLNISQYDSEKNCYWRPDSLAWEGICVNSTCNDFVRGVPSEFKFAVYMYTENKVYISDIVIRKNFDSTFEANLLSNGNIEMKDVTSTFQKSSFRGFIASFIITLILELLVALIYSSNNKITKKILIYVLLANIISLPIVWLIAPLNIFGGIGFMFILAEIFAFAFEAFFIYLFNRQTITLRQSFTLSFVMNLTSLILGNMILFLIVFMGWITI